MRDVLGGNVRSPSRACRTCCRASSTAAARSAFRPKRYGERRRSDDRRGRREGLRRDGLAGPARSAGTPRGGAAINAEITKSSPPGCAKLMTSAGVDVATSTPEEFALRWRVSERWEGREGDGCYGNWLIVTGGLRRSSIGCSPRPQRVEKTDVLLHGIHVGSARRCARRTGTPHRSGQAPGGILVERRGVLRSRSSAEANTTTSPLTVFFFVMPPSTNSG